MRRVGLLFLTLVALATAAPCADPSDMVRASGVRGGLVVHLGCGDGRGTASLRLGEGYLVHGLDADPANVKKARAHVRSLGLYGAVSVDTFDGRRLPYVDNLVNLIVSEGPTSVPRFEIMRCLAPLGVAIIDDRKTVKPWPDDIDEWTHYLHGPGNNAVARDRVVSVPFRMQWLGGPMWARHHNHLSSTSAVVTARGRLFSIVDEGPAATLALPPRWRLVARSAFSGVVLWKKPIGPWEGHMRRFRSGPTELPRRLVAVAERVYVTLGYGRPVSVLDAATGEAIRTLAGTEGAIEIVCDGRAVYVVVGDIDERKYAQAMRTGAPAPAARDRRIVAFNTVTGERIWRASGAETRDAMPTTLCASGGSVFYQNATHVICLNAASGRERWRAARPVKRDRVAFSTPTLVATGGVVLSADCSPAGPKGRGAKDGTTGRVTWRVTSKPKRGDDAMGELVAFSAADGRELWRTPTAQGYTSPADVFVADGIVWTGTAPGNNTTTFTEGRDLRTGEVRRRLDTEAAFASAHHHRCYRPKATVRYILVGRTGTEFIDLAGGEPMRNHWARGSCQYGVLPANGLLYLPQHSCACYIQSKLSGFWALAPRRRAEETLPPGPRLERGPAWGRAVGRDAATREDDWPTLRHDPARSGRSTITVPPKLAPVWEAKIGGRLTAPVIAGGVVLVASTDAHAVHAFDTRGGAELWRFTAGGRIDSPPTIHDGLAIFGSADGHVYCLSIEGGELVWRFRAAPRDRRTVAFGQVESVWPVTGSVLVREGVVYCTAGRSSYLDGGMRLHRLSAETGKLLGTRRLYDRDPATGRQPEDRIEDVELPGALPDVLSCDDENLYLRDKRMSFKGEERPPTVAHLYCSAGLLDGAWWHRTYWLWGERTFGRASGWHIIPKFRPSGRLLVFDEETVFGYGRKRVTYGGTDLGGCHLFRALKRVEARPGKLKNNNKALVRILKPANVKYRWSRETPFVARAMVLAGDVLFAAGPAGPKETGGREPSFDDDGGALLMAFAAEDGAELSRLELGAQPVFDGLAAARGRLYVATVDGAVVCLDGR